MGGVKAGVTDATSLLRRQLRRLWFRVLVLRGEDVSRVSRAARCMVVAPHPDDETLGCGATISAKRAAGTAVRVVIVTDGRRSHGPDVVAEEELVARRSAEAVEACAALGVGRSDVVQLGWMDSTLHGRVDELSRCIEGVIADFAPDEVLVPCALESHPDHRAVSGAVRQLLHSGPRAWQAVEYPVDLPARAALELLVWGSPAVGPGGRPGWARRPAGGRPELVAADQRLLAAKRRAILAYRSQTTSLAPGSPPGLSERDVAKFLRPYEVFWRLDPPVSRHA